MNECIAGLMCGAVRGRPGGPVQKVVAAGGFDNSYNHLSTVEVYNLNSNTWTRGQSNLSVTKMDDALFELQNDQ